jgi:hypothetical protein
MFETMQATYGVCAMCAEPVMTRTVDGRPSRESHVYSVTDPALRCGLDTSPFIEHREIVSQ